MRPDLSDIRIDDLPPEYREIAEHIGLGPAIALAQIRGGEGVYVPRLESLQRAARDRSIRSEFNGSNHRELARRHGVSVSWIYEVIKKRPGKESASGGVDVIDNQLALF